MSMNESIDLSTRLYPMNNRKEIRLTNGEYVTNSSIMLTSIKKKVKLNGLALALDEILLKKNVVGYKSKGSSDICVVTRYDGESMEGALISPAAYTVTNDYDNNLGLLVFTAVNLIAQDEMNMADIFQRLQTVVSDPNYWSDPEKQEAVVDLIGKFCDKGYQYLRDTDGMTIDITEGLSPEQVTQAIKTGTLTPLSVFDKYSSISGSPKAIEDKEKAKVIDFEKDLIVNYDGWTEDQKRNIPQGELSSYVMTQQAESIAKKIKYRMDKVNENLKNGLTGTDAISNNYINILLVGEPGTGKTKMSYVIADMVKMPIYTIPISKNTEEDTFEGKNKVIEGQISFAETDFIKAYENGGIIVLEEINLADPAVIMGSLGQAIEFPFVVMKDGYKPVRRHPMCIIIATMNTGTSGSKALNQALSSRFKQSYILADPDKQLFVKILNKRFKDKKTCRWVAQAYKKIKDYLSSQEVNREDLCQNLSMRACFGALENIEEGEDKKTAVINTMVGKIAEVDLEIANRIKSTVVASLPD